MPELGRWRVRAGAPWHGVQSSAPHGQRLTGAIPWLAGCRIEDKRHLFVSYCPVSQPHTECVLKPLPEWLVQLLFERL